MAGAHALGRRRADEHAATRCHRRDTEGAAGNPRPDDGVDTCRRRRGTAALRSNRGATVDATGRSGGAAGQSGRSSTRDPDASTTSSRA